MTRLNENWFVEPLFDFEYKSYQVLGYRNSLLKYFEEGRFYPYLQELSRHIKSINEYKKAKNILDEDLHRDIEEIDLLKAKIIKAALNDEHGVVSELEGILDFAAKHFANTKHTGLSALSEISKKIDIQPIGIYDFKIKGGFLMFRKPNLTKVYRYQLRLVRRPEGESTYKDVKTNHLVDIGTGLFTNFNEIKWQVLKQASASSETNAFLIETETEVPYFETLLPYVKNYLIRQE